MLQIRAFKQLHRGHGISIFVEDEKHGKFFIAGPLVMNEHSLFESDPEPTVTLPQESAQKLIDDLWDAGLRPSEGSGSAGALAATQRHLEDMRKLVFASAAELSETLEKFKNKTV